MQATHLCVGDPAGGRVAVLFDGSATSGELVRHAAEIARQRAGRLTVIAVTPRPWLTVGLGASFGVCATRLQAELIEHVDGAARRAVAAVPAEVPTTLVQCCGAARRERRRLMRDAGYDLLVTGPLRGRRAEHVEEVRPSLAGVGIEV